MNKREVPDVLKQVEMFVTAVIVILLAVVGYVSTINFAIERSCRSEAEKRGMDYHYSFDTGCLLRANGRWQTPSELRPEVK